MARWTWASFLGLGRSHSDALISHDDWVREDQRALLPQYRIQELVSAIPPEDVTKVALRLRHLIEECVPCELEEEQITRPHSRIITRKVIRAAKEAGGPDHGSCVVFCLLICKRWFMRQSAIELWDADLHAVRSVACEVIAKAIIETEDDVEYLIHSVLLRRYAILIDNKPIPAANVVEKAVDFHAVRVICSSGYQKCISHLWKGWVVQDENDPSVFVDYKGRDDRRFLSHMDPDRIRTPMYQNTVQLLFSVVFLGLYTLAINSINANGVLDTAEILLYVFTLGFIFDELTKFWKAGYHILSFWTAFNAVLYTFLSISLGLRITALAYPAGHPDGLREQYDRLSYNFLAFSAPMFWTRLLLYLDSFRFFGAMLVVLKVMMKESLIFFALLLVMLVGFLQAFVGLDMAEDTRIDDVYFIVQSMANAVMGSPEFSGFDNFAPPFGIILYYLFSFIVMVILLNILIALYNSAYEDIYQNANDEYLAFFAQKTVQFIRAPDENVYIPPFNLVEIVITPVTDWVLSKSASRRANDIVMMVLYWPLLVCTAYYETRAAHRITSNRSRGEEDDDVVQEWEQLASVDFEGEGWTKKCEAVKPNVEDDPAVVEVAKLRAEVAELRMLLEKISEAVGAKTEEKDKGPQTD